MAKEKRHTKVKPVPPGRPKGTSERRKLFAREYLIDFCAARAARAAGFSARTAAQIGHNLLQDPEVQELIRDARAKMDKAFEGAVMSKIEACEVLSAIARGKLGDFLGEKGLIDINAGDPHALQEITTLQHTDEGIVLRVKLHPKIDAIEKLAKLMGWNFADKDPDAGKTNDVKDLTDEQLAAIVAGEDGCGG